MIVTIKKLIDEEDLNIQREKFISIHPDYSCEDAITELINNKKSGNKLEFPVYCKTCWKVLIFGLTLDQAKNVSNLYKPSKYTAHLEKIRKIKKYDGKDDIIKHLVVIYTNNKLMRDSIKKELQSKYITLRVRYRFACKCMQKDFPEMFLSNGTPNPDYI